MFADVDRTLLAVPSLTPKTEVYSTYMGVGPEVPRLGAEPGLTRNATILLVPSPLRQLLTMDALSSCWS